MKIEEFLKKFRKLKPEERQRIEDRGYLQQVLNIIKPSERDVRPIMSRWNAWLNSQKPLGRSSKERRECLLRESLHPDQAKEQLGILKRAGVMVEVILQTEIKTYKYRAQEYEEKLRIGIVQKGKHKGKPYKPSGLKSIKDQIRFLNEMASPFQEALRHVKAIEEEQEKKPSKYPFQIIQGGKKPRQSVAAAGRLA
jgi:hypothetical protein